MNNKKKVLLIALMLVLMLALGCFSACGKPKTVTISFVTDGGPAIESVELEVGEGYTLPLPKRTGYSFEGWYDNADLAGDPITVVTAEKKNNRTFYAKWEKMYAVTLELGGGSLSEETTLYAKEGTNVYDLIKSYVPTLENHEFGEWLADGKPLAADTVLTTAGITLTAHYKVAYTVEIYLQTLSLDGYEKAERDFVGYEYSGVEFTPENDVKGFTNIQHEESVGTKTISENASDNVFKLYFDRNKVELHLFANYPVDTPADMNSDEVLSLVYGQEIELPTTLFTLQGYCLMGWNTDESDEVEYRSSYINSLLYNGTCEFDTFTAEEETSLYAVWVQGYTDLFGGDDYIFHFNETAEDIYLLRGGVMFKGAYRASTGTFLFTTPDDGGDKLVVEGKLNEFGTFSYYSDTRDNFSYVYFKNGVGRNESYKIYLDGYNGITYVDETAPALSNTSKGSYTIEGGIYNVTYTSGPMEGESYSYILSSSSNSGAIFMVRDEEEYSWGQIPRGGYLNGELNFYYGILTLNGFGNAQYESADGSVTSYFYVREDDSLKILNAYGMTMFEARLMVLGNTSGQTMHYYMMYSSAYDVTYTNEASGETLKLDGISSAVYTNARGDKTEGRYSLTSSQLGTIVNFYDESKNSNSLFLVRTETETILGENGESEEVNHYYFDKKPETYSEYNYVEDGRILSSILIVMDDEEKGTASVYGTSANGFVKVLSGRYYQNETNGLYSFETSEVFEAALESQPFEIADIKQFVFSTSIVQASSGSYYAVTYWYSMTNSEGTSNYDVQYRARDYSTLTLIRGFGVYKTAKGEVIATGSCSISENLAYLLDYTNGNSYYFEINEEEKSIVLLDGMLGSLNALLPGGLLSGSETLTFDGKGGVTYSVTTVDENEQSSTVTYQGTYTRTEDVTVAGYYVYKFQSEELTFNFILADVPNGSSTRIYFAKYDEQINGEYTSENGDRLTLDGYGFKAVFYNSSNGTEYNGYYVVTEGNVIRVLTADGYYYLDFDGENFTVRDDVYGAYILIKNQSVAGLIFSFDGYGKLTVITGETGDEAGVGTYEKAEDGSYVLKYTSGADEVTLYGWLGSFSSYNAFYLTYDEVITSYVNEKDWSVLVLDNRGIATRYNETGNPEAGSYVIVTENMLYFVNEDGDDACIYIYDREKGTATPINFLQRAYYSEEFEALLFTRYGFMVMNGQTRYYYNVDDNGNVLLYRQDAADASANKYGFVEEDFFGRFTDEKVLDGKTYYASSSFTLTFTRKAETSGNYPIPVSSVEDKHALEQLKFSPTGAQAFRDTSATVRIDGKDYTCTVVREVLADGTAKMYILIPTNGGGNFRFDINVSYKGDYDDDVNEYEITSMRTETNMYSYTYLTYLINYMMQGYYLPNTFGMITIGTLYDVEGNAGNNYATGVFGENSNLFDTKGNLISFENAEYTYENRTYTVKVEGEDGYTYNLYFAMDNTYYRYLNMLGYGLIAFTREETVSAEGGYTVFAERVLMTESRNVAIGGYWKLTLKKNGEDLNYDAGYVLDGKIYCIVRTTDEESGKIISSTLYVVELKQRTPEDIEDVVGELEPYVSAVVTESALSVAYTADGESFVEYDGAKILLLQYGKNTYRPASCEYDEATKTYTVTITAEIVYTVTIGDDGNATITLVEVPAE